MKRVVIGIDCGLSGGVAAIDGSLNVLALVDTPVVKTKGRTLYNVAAMADVLRRIALMGDATAVLETQQARPGQGVSSMFSIGRGFGVWEGLLTALMIPFQEVHPATWTRQVLNGAPGEGKARCIGWVMRMFPSVEITPPGCRKPRDGRADALALAYYGKKI